MAHGDDLHLARLTPQFREFAALLGHSPKTTESWAPYALLVADHGWDRLLRAARVLHGQDNVFPRDYAKLCLQYQRDSEQEAREAKAREVRDTPVQRSPDEVRYEVWSKHYGIEPWPRWLRELAKKLGKADQ